MCADLGLNEQTVRNSKYLKHYPPLQDTMLIAKYLGCSVESLINDNVSLGSNDYKVLQNTDNFDIPVLEQYLSAGKGSQLPEYDISQGRLPAPASLKKYGNKIAYLIANGDSMEPTISNGDMLICDCCGWDGEGIYAIQLNGEGFVKRLSKTSKSIVILSDNPKYPPREEPIDSECIRIIGKIHEQVHHLG